MGVRVKNLDAYLESKMQELKDRLRLELAVKRKRKYGDRTINSAINASGQGSDSIEVVKDTDGFSIEMADYLQDVDKGTSSTDASVGEIERWVRDKGIRLKDANGKFMKMSDYNVERYALNVSKKLKENGIKAVNFIEPTIDWFMPKLDEIDEALATDLQSSLDEMMTKAGFKKKGNTYIYGN